MPDTLRLAGALMPPHSHDDLVVAVHESDVEVMAAASVLDFGAGLDVTQGPAGEANIALDLSEAIWTFAQGGFRFRDASGPLLSTGASGDGLLLTGALDVSKTVALGTHAFAAINPRVGINLWHYTGDISVMNQGAGISANLYVNSTTQGAACGLSGQAENGSAVGGQSLRGLQFYATQNGAGGVSSLYGADVIVLSMAGAAGTITNCYGLSITEDFQGNKPATYRGIYVGGHAGMNTVYGVRVEDFTGSTIRLLEIGPATPYLRLVGGAAPAANQTNLYLAEGVAPTLRRVQWKDYSSLVAGDRVLVLV
jgi:hypothetical protein